MSIGTSFNKCIRKGAEHYQCGNRFYSVDRDCYLILNQDQYYSSYIHSEIATESFTINFSENFQRTVLNSYENDLDNERDSKGTEFIEKLYGYDDTIATLLNDIYCISKLNKPNVHLLTERYISVMTALLNQQRLLKKEIIKIKALKFSTQIELYKRLSYAKDYIESVTRKT
jgi:hypothetical protein